MRDLPTVLEDLVLSYLFFKDVLILLTTEKRRWTKAAAYLQNLFQKKRVTSRSGLISLLNYDNKHFVLVKRGIYLVLKSRHVVVSDAWWTVQFLLETSKSLKVDFSLDVHQGIAFQGELVLVQAAFDLDFATVDERGKVRYQRSALYTKDTKSTVVKFRGPDNRACSICVTRRCNGDHFNWILSCTESLCVRSLRFRLKNVSGFSQIKRHFIGRVNFPSFPWLEDGYSFNITSSGGYLEFFRDYNRPRKLKKLHCEIPTNGTMYRAFCFVEDAYQRNEEEKSIEARPKKKKKRKVRK